MSPLADSKSSPTENVIYHVIVRADGRNLILEGGPGNN